LKLSPKAIPVPPTPYLDWNEAIPRSVRAQRDGYWDKLSVRRVPLTAPSGLGGGRSHGDFFDTGTEPEILALSNRAILTATFTKYRSVLSASEFSLHTEVTLHVALSSVITSKAANGYQFKTGQRK
jgi:hypothetical protein